MKSTELNTTNIDEKDLNELSSFISINKKVEFLLGKNYRVMEIARAIESKTKPGHHISKQRVVNVKKNLNKKKD